MMNGRYVAITAVLAGALAAPLLAANPAQADELSDLRANQELLQRRLDQLAQIPAPGTPYPGGPAAKTAGAGIVGGSFPRSFLIPGTDTSIRVGGRIAAVADYWFSGGNPQVGQNSTVGNNGQLQSVPLHVHVAPGNFQRSRGTGVFLLTARESALNIETRTPTALGEARTFMEWDWINDATGANLSHVSSGLSTRFRYAYATLGGFLAGQANSNFSDSDAGAETLDFGGNTGGPGVVRLPQVRYTMPLAGWGFPGAFSLSAETPETDAWIPPSGIIGSDNTATGFPTKAASPDFTFAWYIPQPWGHMDFSAVLRPTLQFKDGLFVDKTFTGWGVHFSGDVKPNWFGWPKDYIVWQFTYGDGVGRYVNTSADFSLVSNYPNAVAAGPVSAAAAANVLVKPVVAWGGQLGYRHQWLPNLRSTISGGIFHQDINTNLRTVVPATGVTTGVSAVCSAAVRATATGGGCALNKEMVTAHVNLIWNPVPFADVGIEYVWGHRVVVSNLKGDENVLISRFRVLF